MNERSATRRTRRGFGGRESDRTPERPEFALGDFSEGARREFAKLKGSQRNAPQFFDGQAHL